MLETRSWRNPDLSLLSSRPRAVEEGESSGKGVRVSVEGEVILSNVHSRVWDGVSHLVFHRGYGSVHCNGEDETRHGASLGQSPFHGVGDDITVNFHMFLSKASISLRHGRVSHRRWPWRRLGGWRCGARRSCAVAQGQLFHWVWWRGLFAPRGSGESPQGFPHALTWVSVEFGHSLTHTENSAQHSGAPVHREVTHTRGAAVSFFAVGVACRLDHWCLFVSFVPSCVPFGLSENGTDTSASDYKPFFWPLQCAKFSCALP